ncbi:hypothetical protein Tco_0011912 [Tanacetum coccineum]
MWFCFWDNLCAYDCYKNITWYDLFLPALRCMEMIVISMEYARVTSRPSSPSRSSSHDTLAPSFEFPLAPIVAPLEIHRRKRVGPFPARRLAWRRVSHRSSDHHSSPDFISDSSSSGSSLDSSYSSSSGLPSD